MGKKTSVYLSDSLAARLQASPRKHADLLSSALDAAEAGAGAEPLTAGEAQQIVEQIVRREIGDALTSHGVEQQRQAEGWIRRIVREEVARAASQSY